MEKPKAVISIDFWNTLVKAETGGRIRRQERIDALQKIAERYIDDLPREDIEEAKREASLEFNRIWFNQQRTSTAGELVTNILNHLGIPANSEDQEYLVTRFEESLWKGPPDLMNGVEKILPQLADRYPLALISDTMYSPGRVIRKYLKDCGILAYFQTFIFSNETGYSKPNPKAYQRVLEETGSSAEESWHIGDLMKTDITGAKAVGMKAILFTGTSDYKIDEETECEPDYICDSWEEIGDILLR